MINYERVLIGCLFMWLRLIAMMALCLIYIITMICHQHFKVFLMFSKNAAASN